MKTQSILSFALLVIFISVATIAGYAQNLDEKEVLPAVVDRFKKTYRKHSNASWELKGDNYAVTFIFKDKPVYAELTAEEPRVIFEKTTLEKDDLRPNMTKMIKKEYRKLEYHAIYYIEEYPRNKYFRIEMIPKRWNNEDGEPPVTVVMFASTGRFLSAIKPESEEENEMVSEDHDYLNMSDVPEEIQKAFNKKVRRALDVKWYDVDTAYMATYVYRDNKAYSIFSYDGDWMYTSTYLDTKFKKLHPGILRWFDENVTRKFDYSHTEDIERASPREKYYSVFLYFESEDVDSKDELEVTEIQFAKSGKHIATIEPEYEVERYVREESKKWKQKTSEDNLEEIGEEYGEAEISRKSLPTKAEAFLSNRYDHEWRTRECRAIENEQHGTVYYVVMKKQGSPERYEHFFDLFGNLLSEKDL